MTQKDLAKSTLTHNPPPRQPPSPARPRGVQQLHAARQLRRRGLRLLLRAAVLHLPAPHPLGWPLPPPPSFCVLVLVPPLKPPPPFPSVGFRLMDWDVAGPAQVPGFQHGYRAGVAKGLLMAAAAYVRQQMVRDGSRSKSPSSLSRSPRKVKRPPWGEDGWVRPRIELESPPVFVGPQT